VKSERLSALQALLGEQQIRFNHTCAGRNMPVLFEKPGRKPGQAVGRSPWLQAVHVDDAVDLIGTIREVVITAPGPNSLHGVLLGKESAGLRSPRAGGKHAPADRMDAR
jgi:tRNA-2-methylthio-N6-dimethylallyladenosine synthase